VGDRERQNRAFIRKVTLLKGQGGTESDTGLWYRCGMKGEQTPHLSKTLRKGTCATLASQSNYSSSSSRASSTPSKNPMR
jgi:hypothetical protein